MEVCLTIPFPSVDTAILAYEVLSVDKELKRSQVKRNLVRETESLVITFHGDDLRKLRVGVNAFIKNAVLVLKTIELLSDTKK